MNNENYQRPAYYGGAFHSAPESYAAKQSAPPSGQAPYHIGGPPRLAIPKSPNQTPPTKPPPYWQPRVQRAQPPHADVWNLQSFNPTSSQQPETIFPPDAPPPDNAWSAWQHRPDQPQQQQQQQSQYPASADTYSQQNNSQQQGWRPTPTANASASNLQPGTCSAQQQTQQGLPPPAQSPSQSSSVNPAITASPPAGPGQGASVPSSGPSSQQVPGQQLSSQHLPPSQRMGGESQNELPYVNRATEITQCLKVLRRVGYNALASLVEDDCSKGVVGQSDVLVAEKLQSAHPLLTATKRLTAKENPVASWRNYVNLYTAFWNWTLRAVDPVRPTLREVAFVILVELWARLLPLDMKRAKSFLHVMGEGHWAHHRQEMLEMKKMQSMTALQDLPFVVKVLRGERFHIRADYLSRKLLTTRLAYDNDTVLMDILQKRVSFEPPADNVTSQKAEARALLSSSYIKNAGYRDLGKAIVTPSLAILCGLTPIVEDGLAPGDLERLNKAEPMAKRLPKELLSLYRLPVSSSSNAGLEWRHKLSRQSQLDSVLSRDDIGLNRLPSILTMKVSNRILWPNLGIGAPVNLDIITIDRHMLAATDRSGCCAWLIDIQESQWERCSQLYFQSLFTPWLYKYAQTRLKDIDSIRRQESNELEPTEITAHFINKTISVLGQDMDQVIQKLDDKLNERVAAGDDGDDLNGGDQEEFIKELNILMIDGKNNRPRCLVGHQMPLTGFQFLNPFLSGGAAKLALTGSYDCQICLWDIENSFKIHTYKGGAPVSCLDTDPSYGYLFLSGHLDRCASLWCMDRQNPLRILNRHSGQVDVVKFHPNSILLATGSTDQRIRLWDPRVPDVVGIINDCYNPKMIEFAPNGRYVVFGSDSTENIQVWDLFAGRMINNISLPTPPTSIAIAHGSDIAAVTTQDGLLQIWDLCGQVSKAGLGSIDEPNISAIDLPAAQINKELIQSLKNTKNRGCLASYEYHDCIARKAYFTPTNVLLCATESDEPYSSKY